MVSLTIFDDELFEVELSEPFYAGFLNLAYFERIIRGRITLDCILGRHPGEEVLLLGRHQLHGHEQGHWLHLSCNYCYSCICHHLTTNLISSAAVVQLKTLTSALVVDECLSNISTEKARVLQKILVYVVSIIFSFTDLNLSGHGKTLYSDNIPHSFSTNWEEVPNSSIKVSMPEASNHWQQKATVLVMEAGGLNWLVGGSGPTRADSADPSLRRDRQSRDCADRAVCAVPSPPSQHPPPPEVLSTAATAARRRLLLPLSLFSSLFLQIRRDYTLPINVDDDEEDDDPDPEFTATARASRRSYAEEEDIRRGLGTSGPHLFVKQPGIKQVLKGVKATAKAAKGAIKGYFFNPRIQYKDNVHNDGEVMRGTMNVITRLLRTMNERLDAMVEVERYKMKLGIYGGYDMRCAVQRLTPGSLGPQGHLLHRIIAMAPALPGRAQSGTAKGRCCRPTKPSTTTLDPSSVSNRASGNGANVREYGLTAMAHGVLWRFQEIAAPLLALV
ncbi:hypothetical protein Taro_001294 [Colocasia esculenta]|uniref:Uncharacterized protein n=1 Tax=Colocasia esculenta TaxID=4460 RepID=A0A843TEA4_COLES|nr:hypothetical protein [Colocasia esculenta]